MSSCLLIVESTSDPTIIMAGTYIFKALYIVFLAHSSVSLVSCLIYKMYVGAL